MRNSFQLLLIISFLFCVEGVAQVNLVPNPSFEDTLACPQTYPDLDGVCLNWSSYKITPDYLNSCSSVCGFYNQFGFQNAHSGSAYAGVATYHVNLPDTREHIGVSLNAPLSVGTRYYVSFFVSPAFNVQANIACDHLGALFTTYSYSDPNGTMPLPNYSHIVSTSIIQDTVNWTKVFGSFVADSSYNRIILGGFFDDSSVDTLHLPDLQFGNYLSYYYIDDVCVSSDSAYAQHWTEFQDSIDQNVFSVYPNPSTAGFSIECGRYIRSVVLINNLGQQVFSASFFPEKQVVHIEPLVASGTYIILVQTNDSMLHSRLVISP